MSCDDVRDLLALAPDGLLAPAEVEALDRHLAACAACRAARDGIRRVVRGLAASPAPPAPIGFKERTLARLAVGASAPAPAAVPAPARPVRRIWTPVAVAALLLVGVALVWRELRPPPTAPAGRFDLASAPVPAAAEMERGRDDAARPEGPEETKADKATLMESPDVISGTPEQVLRRLAGNELRKSPPRLEPATEGGVPLGDPDSRPVARWFRVHASERDFKAFRSSTSASAQNEQFAVLDVPADAVPALLAELRRLDAKCEELSSNRAIAVWAEARRTLTRAAAPGVPASGPAGVPPRAATGRRAAGADAATAEKEKSTTKEGVPAAGGRGSPAGGEPRAAAPIRFILLRAPPPAER